MTQEKLPKIIQRQSKSVNLEPGTYYYCRCGLSKDGIFCDDSHHATGFEPKRFKVSEPSSLYLCMCRYSDNLPFCDGKHRSLPE